MVLFYLLAFLKHTYAPKPAFTLWRLDNLQVGEGNIAIHGKFPEVLSVAFITLPKTFSQESARIFHTDTATDLEFVDRASHADMSE